MQALHGYIYRFHNKLVVSLMVNCVAVPLNLASLTPNNANSACDAFEMLISRFKFVYLETLKLRYIFG